jgi:hypothetical protein
MVLGISSVQIFAEEAIADESPAMQSSIAATASTVITMDRSRNIDSIVAKAKELTHSGFDSSKVTSYASQPNFTAPYAAGSLAASDIADALKTFKMLRYVAGLPYENLAFTDELNNIAQHGSVLLAASDQFSHGPAKPADMSDEFFALANRGCGEANIFSGLSNISNSIIGFAEDPGSGNIGRAGHRRWLLKPGGLNYGIGYARFSTGSPRINLHVFDGPSTPADTYVAWPSSGDFPIQYFIASTDVNSTAEPPWSINLGDAYSVPTRNDINLVLKRTRDGKSWTFNSSTPLLGDGNYPAENSMH